MIKTNTLPERDNREIQVEFQAANGKRLLIDFDEPELTSDAGTLALAEFEKSMGLFDALARSIGEKRSRCVHSVRDLIAQRVFQIASGQGDASGCSRLRADPALQFAVGSEGELASQPTMTRLENSVGPKDLIRMAYAMGELFLDSFEKAPEMIVIDMDPTAHLVYGCQQLALFEGHVGNACLMPFHVYDGITGRLITATVRPGKTPAAGEILALLKRVVRSIRNRFPDTRLLFRADSHHSKPEVMDWMEANDVDWAVGLQGNNSLDRLFASTIDRARKTWEERERETGCRRGLTLYASAQYQARTWSRPRRVICRVVAGPLGADARYVSTSYGQAGAKFLYSAVYCDRGRAELMIKDHKLGLRSDRSPCRSSQANQFRLLLHNAAYALLHRFRETVLASTSLARASFQRLRLEFLKVAGRVQRLRTRTRFHLPRSFAFKEVFVSLAGGEQERLV